MLDRAEEWAGEGVVDATKGVHMALVVYVYVLNVVKKYHIVRELNVQPLNVQPVGIR
jgi:hypothetical protein